MSYVARTTLLSVVALLLSNAIGSAERSSALLAVRAEVTSLGCTALFRAEGGTGALSSVPCSSSVGIAPFREVLHQFGGVAGPDDMDGPRVILAY